MADCFTKTWLTESVEIARPEPLLQFFGMLNLQNHIK